MSETGHDSSRMTALNPQYPSCEETRAKLLICPEISLAEDITQVLGIKPTQSHNKGSLHKNAIGRTRRAPRTVWVLSSEGHVRSKDLRDHLNWLLTKVSGAESKILWLQEEDGLKMTVSCVWWSVQRHGGPTLWPEQMEALARLNLECGFDVCFFGDDSRA